MGGTENAELVRRYFDTLRREGLEAFLGLLPSDVEWHLHSERSRTIWGSDELRGYLEEAAASGRPLRVEISDVEAIDDDNVLVTGTLHRGGPDASSERVAWLYSFRDGRLWRASGHSSVEEARQAGRFMHTDRLRLDRQRPHFAMTLHQEAGGRSVLQPIGELDLGCVDDFRAAIRRAAASGHVLIDLSGLDFMDSSGLRTLLEAAREARDEGWRLELRRGSEVVHRVIAMTGADRLLPFEP